MPTKTTNQKKQESITPKPRMGEIGTRTGYTTVLGEYEKEERRQDEIPITDYRKMRANDGKVSALVALYTLPIWRMSFNIDPVEGGEKEADFIRENFTQPYESGGTLKSFESYLRDMVYFIFDGFRPYEKVWYIDQNKKIKLKKLALRDPTTVTIVTEKDEVVGMKQGQVEIPAEKTFLLVYNPSEDPAYGMSILRPVWYHWDKKHKLYYIAHVAAEVQTVPPRVLKHKGMDSGQLTKLENALDRLGLESRITYNSNTAEVEFLDVTSGAKVDIMSLIQHHDNQASKAMLAMWVDLSSEGNAAGSRALGSPMIDIYEQNIESITTIIEDEINRSIIPQLINWNFATKKYPKFRFSPLDQQSEGLIRQAFIELVKKGLPDELSMDIIGKIARRFDIEFDVDEQLKLQADKKAEDQKKIEAGQKLALRNNASSQGGIYQNPQEKGMQKNVNLEQKKKLSKFSETDIINLVEESGEVNLVDYANKIKNIEDRMAAELNKIADEISETVTGTLLRAITTRDYNAINSLEIPMQDKYEEIVMKYQREMYTWAKLKAAEEIGINTPPTDEDIMQKIKIKTRTIVDNVFSDLINSLISMAMVGIDMDWDKNKISLGLWSIMGNFRNNTIPLGVMQSSGETFNTARKNVFSKAGVEAYRFTNSLEHILRGTVCEYCKKLHGMTVEKEDPRINRYTPPLHYRCFCMWEPVKEGEEYEVSGDMGVPYYESVEEFEGLTPRTETKNFSEVVKEKPIDKETIDLVKELLYDKNNQ